jgi:hypothetical protein
MRKFFGIACSMILGLAVADVGTGKAPVEGIAACKFAVKSPRT